MEKERSCSFLTDIDGLFRLYKFCSLIKGGLRIAKFRLFDVPKVLDIDSLFNLDITLSYCVQKK